MGISVASTERLFHPLLPSQIGIWNVGFCRGRKTGVSREKPENQQQPQPTYGINTLATLVGDKCPHHCAIPRSAGWYNIPLL